MRRITRGFVLAVAALVALTLTDAAHAQKKTLVVALNQDPDILDPTLARTYVGRIVFSHICEKLYEIDESIKIHPQLAADMPRLEIGHAAYPTDQNETGARGLGDGSSMNTPACIANAIADALGCESISIPAGPSRLWSMINGVAPDAHLCTAPAPSGMAEVARPGMLRGEGEQKLPGTPETV